MGKSLDVPLKKKKKEEEEEGEEGKSITYGVPPHTITI